MTEEDSYTRAQAEYFLGKAYLNGENVQKNIDLAFFFLEKASQRGHREASLILEQIGTPKKNELYPESLIHKTWRGESVRSKSEVIIANTLFHYDIEYAYERPIHGKDNSYRYPDFTIFCFSGRIILWEHLGLSNEKHYRLNWERKKQWYKENNFNIGKNLFTSQDIDDGRIDSQKILSMTEKIRDLVFNM